ncbi:MULTISPECIES: DUF7344 domain-containing protein [Salinibaculum]|uniref:DUF7344 domain-containing protein n=1 Tax=Salinibaculum TaxID=2732368 RepID=UPI0030CB97D8
MFQKVSIPESDVYYLLSNPRRRETLTLLWRCPDEVSLRELSEQIASTESGETPAPRALRESVYNALHQTHLPKLDEFGLVAYDPNRKLVRPRREGRHLSRYMDTVTPAGITWGEYYRGLGIGGLFAVVASLADLPGFAAVDPLVFASGALGLFALSTAYQLVSGTSGRLAALRARLGLF